MHEMNVMVYVRNKGCVLRRKKGETKKVLQLFEEQQTTVRVTVACDGPIIYQVRGAGNMVHNLSGVPGNPTHWVATPI